LGAATDQQIAGEKGRRERKKKRKQRSPHWTLLRKVVHLGPYCIGMDGMDQAELIAAGQLAHAHELFSVSSIGQS
jgi:hypothetical protein